MITLGRPTNTAGQRATNKGRIRSAGERLSVVLVAVTVAACASSSTPARTSPPPATASAAATAGAPSAAPSGSASSARSKVIEDLVAALHVDPFQAHIDESILASSLSGATKVQVTANAVGDISGSDVSLHITGTGGGTATDQEIVSVGQDAWIRAKGATIWELHPRTDVAPSLDGLMQTIRLIRDPAQLVDTGLQTVDGQRLHHLLAPMSVGYTSPDGAAGTYESFEIWATDAGIPVLVKATFTAAQDTNSITGSTEIHYTKVGGPITIMVPAGAPTPAP